MANSSASFHLPRALDMARTDNLDLVEVSPDGPATVCRLLDYGKYKYEQTRKEREARKTQKTQTLKEMRLKPKIGEHDLVFKTKLIQGFLNEGDKVKVTVNFRGRENAHPELGRVVLEEVVKRLDGSGVGGTNAPARGTCHDDDSYPGATKARTRSTQRAGRSSGRPDRVTKNEGTRDSCRKSRLTRPRRSALR